jgi:hypothetical protein
MRHQAAFFRRSKRASGLHRQFSMATCPNGGRADPVNDEFRLLLEPHDSRARPQQMLRVSVYAAGDASITCMEEAIPVIRSIRNPEARNSSSN